MQALYATIASFSGQHKTLATTILGKTKQLRAQKAVMLSLVGQNASTEQLQAQQQTIDTLEGEIATSKASLKLLRAERRVASTTLLSNSSVPVTKTTTPTSHVYDGPRGPTGPTGTTQHVSVDLTLTSESSNAASSGAVYDAVQSASSGDVVNCVNSLPSNPVTGEVCYNQSNNTMCVYTDSGWKTVSTL